MLSIYTLKSAADASKYYQQGDYYTQGGANEHSQWLGKGSEILGLQGPVDYGIFKGLLEGHLPDGTMMTNIRNGTYHRPGYDLTFSAPKSFSILALVSDNKELLEMYRESVKEVIDKIEQKYASCRNKSKGVINIAKTGNFTVAAFEHIDSREGDPNLHIHCVLMNMTLRSDGHWRTIFADNIYDDKLLNGMELRSILARKLLKEGYELEFRKDGTFEIADVPEHLRKIFSKRREEIKEWLKAHNLSGGEAAKTANFQTRANKQSIDPIERKERWLNELKEAGYTLEDLKKVASIAKERGPIKLPDPYVLAQDGLQVAIEHLSERQPLFSIPDLLKAARRISLFLSAESDFLKAIEEKIKDKTLIYVEDKLLTTAAAHAIEAKNIAEMQKGKNSVTPMMCNWIADFYSQFKLNTDTQKAALKDLLTNEDRNVLISTESNAMLNEVLKAFNQVCQNQPFYLRFLTQKASSVEILKNKLNVERVNTIEGFLLACEARFEKRNPNPNILERWGKRIKAYEARDIWVVQGEISLNQIARLQHWSKEFGTRIVFTQSNKQSIPALTSLRNEGIQHIQISAPKYYQDDLRAKDEVLKNIKRLEDRNAIQIVPDYQQRLNVAVEQNLPQHSSFILVALTNTERIELNALVRNQLKTKDILTGDSISINTLQALTLTAAEKSQCQLYQPGDIIRFNDKVPGTLIEKGSYFEVYKVNLESGALELHDRENNQIFWKPEETKNLKSVEVFRVASRELMVGDTIVWTRTIKHESNKLLDRIKNEKASVIKIDNYRFTVRLKNDVTLALDEKDIKQHWDYGYAMLLKNIEFSTLKDITLVLQSSTMDNKAIHQLQEFFAYSKELKLSPQLVCDNLEKLKENIESGGIHNLPTEGKEEIPYKREEALSEHQSIATQPIFHGLQKEYLKIRGLNPEFLEQNLKADKIEINYSPEFRLACDVVDRVCLYHSERDTVSNLKELQKEAAQLGGLQTSIENIEKAFQLAVEKGWLLVVPNPKAVEDTLVTTRHTLLLEKFCIQKIKEGQNQLRSILPVTHSSLNTIKEHKQLTKGQKEAIQLVFTSTDRFVAIQGVAGVGKTTALKEINKICQEVGVKALVLADTGSAKNQAKHKSQMQALTTAQFLTRLESLLTQDYAKAKQEYGNTLIVLDEASMISTQNLFRLEKIVEQLDARSCWFGDFKQIGSIGAGDILFDSLAYGVNKTVMKENVRLSDAMALYAMKKAYRGDIAGTLDILKNSIEEIPNKEEALTRIVEVYFAIEKHMGREPLVITPLNEDRHFVNHAIREKMKENEALQGNALMVKVYLPTDRREIDKKEVSSYKVEDIIRFNIPHSRLGIKSGDYVKIVDIDLKHHRLTLQSEDGKKFYWGPKDLQKSSNIEIYREETRELMKNERIVFKRNHEAQGIFNGDKATILKIEENIAQVLLVDGKTISLDFTKKEHQHLDYGYALTPYAAQGKDEKWVITYGEGPKSHTRKTHELRVRDTIVLPKEDMRNEKYSKVVVVTEIKDNQLILKSREGELYTLDSHKDRVWDYFPPFDERKAKELPLSTSQQSLIVQITRGDGFFMVVPNLSDYQKTLEQHERIKRSALSHFDINRNELDKAVKRLVENIKGKEEKGVKEDNPHPSEKKIDISEKGGNAKTNHKAQSSQSSAALQKLNAYKVDIDELKYRLEKDILGYATRWLGPYKKLSGNEARWSGTLTVQFKGLKVGMWKRWSTGEGGKDLISLYMAAHGVEWKVAIKELAESSGLSQQEKGFRSRKTKIPKASVKDLKAEEKERQEKIAKAQLVYKRAVPIQGTLAEKYLREHRGISGELPEDFKFSPGIKHLDTQKLTPALIAPIRDKDNSVIGIARIFLNKDGSKLKEHYSDENGKIQEATTKANFGLANHGAVIVQRGILPTTLWIAEGIETALSIANALPHQTVVAATSVERMRLVPISQEVQKVVLCADNDGHGSHSTKSVIKAAEHHLAEEKRVFIAMPPEVPKELDKYDFNDVLKQEGIREVQAILERKVEVLDVNLLKRHKYDLASGLKQMQDTNKEYIAQDSVPLAVGRELER